MKKYLNEDMFRIIISIILFLISLIVPNPFKLIILIVSYIIISIEVYEEALENLKKKEFFDETTLMIVATIGAFIIGNYTEAVIVMLLYEIGEYLSDLAVSNSKKSITKLMDLRSDEISIVGKDNEIEKKSIKKAVLGDIFVVLPGERIPLDGIVVEGTSSVDTSSLTGESLPRVFKENEEVLSGYINRDSILKIKATTTYKTSTATRIIELIENSNSKKTDTEKFIHRFAKIYTPIIMLLALLIIIIFPLCGYELKTSIYKALVFLVTACPCALVISVPLGYFCGIGAASREKIIIKGSKELEKLNNISYLALDKTGTITEGSFEITNIVHETLIEDEFLSIIASAEEKSLHPIGKLIKEYDFEYDKKDVKNYKEEAGKGISCTIDKQKVLVGNAKLLTDYKVNFTPVDTTETIIYLALNNKYEGYITISDKIKESSKSLAEMKNYFKDIVIVSGDNLSNVEDIAKKLDIETYHGNLLPLDKVEVIKDLQKTGKVMFVGDGINDAIVINESDLGVSMGNIGSDAAIEASDMIIMNDDLSRVKVALDIAKATRRKVIENITFALIVKFTVLVLGLLGISTIWMAVFADVGVTFLAILNVLTIMWKKY